MCANALALRAVFAASSVVKAVTYPGSGFLIGITFRSAAQADRFIETCPVIFPSTSFGGIHTSAERRARWGDAVEPGYVRVSVGCEPEAGLSAAIGATLAGLAHEHD